MLTPIIRIGLEHTPPLSGCWIHQCAVLSEICLVPVPTLLKTVNGSCGDISLGSYDDVLLREMQLVIGPCDSRLKCEVLADVVVVLQQQLFINYLAAKYLYEYSLISATIAIFVYIRTCNETTQIIAII